MSFTNGKGFTEVSNTEPVNQCSLIGGVVELKDTLVLGTSVERRESLSLSFPTIFSNLVGDRKHHMQKVEEFDVTL